MSGILYWVWLSGLFGLRPKTRVRLLEQLGTPQEAYFAPEQAYEAIEGIRPEERQLLLDKSLDRANDILEACSRLGVEILTLQDAAYPQRLTHIYDPPSVLYVKGRLPWIDEQCAVAIVGTRRATPYGIKMGRRLGYEIARAGGLVVSGLAEGVDAAGAEGALRGGGSCVGVLGTAIDVIYPKKNAALFADVAAAGALVSEYPPGAPVMKMTFPMRNRILAGLSCGVTVIEAPERSGALITAARAAEFGRDVFVVPGNADAVNCQGSNALIRDGAKAVSCGWDVLSEYTGRFPRLRRPGPQETWLAQDPDPARTGAPVSGENVPAEAPEGAGRETGAGFARVRRPTDVGRAREKERKRREEQSWEEARRQRLMEQLDQLTETQLKLLSAISAPETHIDEIIEAAALPAGVALAELTVLQIKGYVTQSSGKRFSLNIEMK